MMKNGNGSSWPGLQRFALGKSLRKRKRAAMDDVGQRVRDAVKAAEAPLSQSEIARHIGVGTDALSRSLNGQRKFSAVELSKLAALLNVSLQWLVTGTVSDSGAGGSTTGGTSDLVAETVAFPAGAYREVNLSTPGIPKLEALLLPEQAAMLVAARLRENADRGFAEDIPAAIESAYGIGVFVVAEGPAFDARAMDVGDLAYIVVRSTGAWYEANMVLLRELGALLADKGYRIGIRQESLDRWTEEFAAALLMPDATMREMDWGRQTPGELAGYLWRAGVSAKSLIRRLDALGIARGPALVHADEGTLQLLAWHDPDCLSHPRAWAYRSPRVPADLLAAHLKAMRAGLVTGESVAWMLDTPLEDL